MLTRFCHSRLKCKIALALGQGTFAWRHVILLTHYLFMCLQYSSMRLCVCARVSPKVKRDRLNQTCHDEMIRQVLLRRGQKDAVAIGRGYKKDVSGSVDIHRADETCLIVARRS